MYHDATGYPVQVVVDEAHEVLPDGQADVDNPVKRMLHEDRDRALKVVVATQAPSDFDYTPIKQCKYWCWVGEWSVFHDRFIRYVSIPPRRTPDQAVRVRGVRQANERPLPRRDRGAIWMILPTQALLVLLGRRRQLALDEDDISLAGDE